MKVLYQNVDLSNTNTTQDWVVFMSQPCWVEVKVEVDIEVKGEIEIWVETKGSHQKKKQKK